MKLPKTAKKIASVLMTLTLAAASIVFIFIFYAGKDRFIAINAAIVIFAAIVYLVIKLFEDSNLYKLFSLTIFCYFTVFALLAILRRYGVISLFSSGDKIRELVKKAGFAGVIIFILIQVAQVIVSPVPGMATVIVGAQVFGPLLGFVYSTIGITIGSIIAFSIGKLFGKRAVQWLIGEKETIEYRKKLEKKGKLLLPVAFLFPFFPDDILCIAAGITTMSYGFFIAMTLITRPVSILISSYFASGKVIPFRGWWLALWGVLGVLILTLFIVVYKKQEQIENWLTNKFKRKKY